MAAVLRGWRQWTMDRDESGHRTYRITWLVEVSDPNGDGPAVAAQCPGLPLPGSTWFFGSDLDVWATCRWEMAVAPAEGEDDKGPNIYWHVTQTFSTKPLEKGACRDGQFEDPLTEPQKVSGSFVKYTEEATRDKDGNGIVNSAWEQMRGPQVEFDRNRPTVRIEQNVAALNMPLVSLLIDRVNSSPLWGLPARCVKLSGFSWEKKFYGFCYAYYTRVFEFDINYNTFDRTLQDEGTKVLRGQWNSNGQYVTVPVGRLLGVDIPPDPDNPAHFVRFKDRNNENSRVILNGAGMPYLGDLTTGTGDDTIGTVFVQYYSEGDFSALGIPTTL